MRKLSLLITLVAAFGLSIGCATVIDLGQSTCEAILGGSKAGDLCAELDQLRDDSSADAEAAE